MTTRGFGARWSRRSPRRPARAAKALARTAALWRTPALETAHQAAIDLLVGLADELSAVEYTQVLVETRADGLSDEEQTAVSRLFAADNGPVAEIFAGELVDRLQAGYEPGRRLVDQTLVAMGSISVGPLVSALDDARRRSAAAALGAIRDARAVPALIELLSGTRAGCAGDGRARWARSATRSRSKRLSRPAAMLTPRCAMPRWRHLMRCVQSWPCSAPRRSTPT
jgi:PBS lyase HEAT-like repeat